MDRQSQQQQQGDMGKDRKRQGSADHQHQQGEDGLSRNDNIRDGGSRDNEQSR
jgi:hypothetical protein